MNRLPILPLILVVIALTDSAWAAPATQPAVVRCAVIGGLVESGLWPAIAERFEKQTGIRVEVVASGPKEDIDKVIRRGGIDLITMHASDTILNLVADGLASDPQPWLRNDMALVGPPDDPAGIKGETDATKAFGKIAATRANFVVHSSLGAQEVLRSILQNGDTTLDLEHTTILFDDKQRRVLKIAADKKAYTLVGRIPFRNGKLPNDGLVIMVQGDPKLRRPYLVAVTNPAWVNDAHVGEAKRLATFLRSPETQAWIATFGKTSPNDLPLFFPVSVGKATTKPAQALLTVSGEIPHSLNFTAAKLAALPRHRLEIKGRDGKPVNYSGVTLRDVLLEAGAKLGANLQHGDPPTLCAVIEGEDGYRATFSLSELDTDPSERSPLLADKRGDEPLIAGEGPLRLIVPTDTRAARWVRQVVAIRVVNP